MEWERLISLSRRSFILIYYLYDLRNPSFTQPTCAPSTFPTTDEPSASPTVHPSNSPSTSPTSDSPSVTPTDAPSTVPSRNPTGPPSLFPSSGPSQSPRVEPTGSPTVPPTTDTPTIQPSDNPTFSQPSYSPSVGNITLFLLSKMLQLLWPVGWFWDPTVSPSQNPSVEPTFAPSVAPTVSPSDNPSVGI